MKIRQPHGGMHFHNEDHTALCMHGNRTKWKHTSQYHIYNTQATSLKHLEIHEIKMKSLKVQSNMMITTHVTPHNILYSYIKENYVSCHKDYSHIYKYYLLFTIIILCS